jgi:hypothetical protein
LYFNPLGRGLFLGLARCGGRASALFFAQKQAKQALGSGNPVTVNSAGAAVNGREGAPPFSERSAATALMNPNVAGQILGGDSKISGP